MGVETYTIHIVNKMIYANTKKGGPGGDRWHSGQRYRLVMLTTRASKESELKNPYGQCIS